MQQFEKIRQYTALVCDQIRWKKSHSIIAEEIENHIIDQANALIGEGINEEMAVDKAIAEMGDPIIVGSQLDRTHRPKTEWSIIAFVAVALFMGIAVRAIIPESMQRAASSSFGKDLLIAAIGFACMLIAYLIDFTIIGKYPKRIFGLLLAAALVLLIIAPNSVNAAAVYVNGRLLTIQYLMLIFPTAYAGILYCMRNKGYLGIIISGLLYTLPALVGIISVNTSSVFYYTLACLILLTYAILKGWFNVRRLYGISFVYLSAFICSSLFFKLFLLNSDYRLRRLSNFIFMINPHLDPYGSGYINLSIRNIVRSAKLVGQSEFFSVSNFVIPNIDTDYLLTYLIYRFGFISLIIIMTFMLIFVMHLAFLSKQQKSVLGKLISTAIIITFSIQIAAYLVNNLGFQILSALPLPFVAYGGLATITNMSLMGILLSVFKSGSIVRDYHGFRDTPGKFIQIVDGKIIIDIGLK